MISQVLPPDRIEEIGELKIGIYEFLLKCHPVHELDGSYTATGHLLDHSTYVMQCKEWDMETLADDMGVGIREGESAWEAIQRYMENELNAEKKEVSGKDKME